MQTVKGKDHEEKRVVILSINELAKMIRSRVAIIEETFGLLSLSHVEFFAAVIHTRSE